MGRRLPESANPPLAAGQCWRVNLEFLTFWYEGGRCFQAGHVGTVAKLGLHVTPKDGTCCNEVCVFFQEGGSSLEHEDGLECWTMEILRDSREYQLCLTHQRCGDRWEVVHQGLRGQAWSVARSTHSSLETRIFGWSKQGHVRISLFSPEILCIRVINLVAGLQRDANLWNLSNIGSFFRISTSFERASH